MIKRLGIPALFALSGCFPEATLDSTGRAVSGPIGQKAVIAGRIEAPLKAAISACFENVSSGSNLTGLTGAGFEAWNAVIGSTGNGHRYKFRSPISIRSGRIFAYYDEAACTVSVSPVYPFEGPTVRALANEINAENGTNIQASVSVFQNASDVSMRVRIPRNQ